MPNTANRVAKLEERLIPPPLQKVCVVPAEPDGSHPPYPADFGPDDMMIVLMPVKPAHGGQRDHTA